MGNDFWRLCFPIYVEVRVSSTLGRHPDSSSAAASNRMKRVRQKGTAKELALRSALHRLGLRFRVQVAPLKEFKRHADIVFTRERVAIFVDGCFWHVCPLHRTVPKANAEWWNAKLEANVRRDEETNAQLRAAGWTVLRFWEHEDFARAAEQIEQIVRARRIQ